MQTTLCTFSLLKIIYHLFFMQFSLPRAFIENVQTVMVLWQNKAANKVKKHLVTITEYNHKKIMLKHDV